MPKVEWSTMCSHGRLCHVFGTIDEIIGCEIGGATPNDGWRKQSKLPLFYKKKHTVLEKMSY